MQEYSTLFFDLPSTTDRKEKINQFVKNVFLHPIDCQYEDFKKHSQDQTDFRPQDLDSPDLNKRLGAREIVINFFKDAAQVSNSNLVHNANTLLLCGGAKINADGVINLIGKSQRLDQDRFKCTYFCLEKTKKQPVNSKFLISDFPITFWFLVFRHLLYCQKISQEENFANQAFREIFLISREFNFTNQGKLCISQ